MIVYSNKMNIQEVISITHEKRNKLKLAIKKMIENIHKKILYYAKHKKEACTYFIPPMVEDFPIYDRKTAICEIYRVLNEEGYIVTAFENGQLDICWNERLVGKKLNSDRFLLQQEEKRVNTISKKTKVINERFNFLANPNKVVNEPTLEEKIDQQVEHLLKQKDREQKQMAKKVGNFTKIMY